MKPLPQRVARLLGRLLLASAAASAVYAIAWLLKPADSNLNDFPRNWARMAEQPFASVGQFPQRFLAPLLAHVLGFGPHWHPFCCVLSVVFLAVVFWFCRARGCRPIDALLVTFAIGISGAIQIYKEVWRGYPDHLTFALLFACALAARRSVVFWALHLANLCTHEVAFFVLPWLLFVRRRNGASLRADIAGLVITSAAYAGMRLAIGARATEHAYTVRYFAEHHLFPNATIWLVVLVLQFWLITYGPLLVVLGWHQRANVFGRERLELWMLLASLLCIFLFAYDFNRHGNILVVPVVLASVRFLLAGHRGLYAACIAGMMATVWALDGLVEKYFILVTLDCGVPDDFKNVMTCAFPRTWLAILACIAAIAAQFWLGAWLWRRDERSLRTAHAE